MEQVRKAVRNMRRRYILYYLNYNDGVATVDELVERIAAWESGSASEDVPSRKRESVYSSIYQTHLPKLEQIGLVRYDDSDKTVAITDVGERVSLRCAADSYPGRGFAGSILGLSGLVLALIVLRQWAFIPQSLFFELSTVLAVGLSLVAFWQFYVVRTWKRRYMRRGPDYILDLEDTPDSQ